MTFSQSQQTLYMSLAILHFEPKAVLGTLIYKYIPSLHANIKVNDINHVNSSDIVVPMNCALKPVFHVETPPPFISPLP